MLLFFSSDGRSFHTAKSSEVTKMYTVKFTWQMCTLSDCCRYVDRFRHAAPLSREQRQKMSAADVVTEFWWLRGKDDKDTSSERSGSQPHDNRLQMMVRILVLICLAFCAIKGYRCRHLYNTFIKNNLKAFLHCRDIT